MAHILVVEDQPSFANALHDALELVGHEVWTALDGKTGMEIYEQNAIDLVITDVMMPEQDGLEIIQQLRRRTPRPKIIAMSGGGRYGMVQVLQVAKVLGADATLVKPFPWQELVDTVNELLEGTSGAHIESSC